MKRIGFLLVPSVVVLGVIGIIFWAVPTIAGLPNTMTNADYSGTPPFIASVVTPNVLIMLDNSGSMGYRSVCDNTTNDFLAMTSLNRGASGTPAGKVATVTYGGAHGFVAADVGVTQITISGVDTTIASNANYNGTFVILSIPSPNTLTYQMAAEPGTPSAPGNPQLVIAPPDPRAGNPAPNVYGNCPTATALYPAGTPDGAPFREAVTFAGLFDSLSCYTYDTTNTRFDPSSTKAVINSACGATEWDGNYLNWATFRRQDALKKALIGGECAVARASDGSCPASGSPAKITMKGANGALSLCCANESTAPVDLSALAPHNAIGRVPTAIQTLVSAVAGPPCCLVLHLMASTAMTSGGFCVGASTVAPPSSGNAACGITGVGTPANGEFIIQVSVATEPTGVVQDLGDKARFGLIEFRVYGAGNGGKVLVPIGSTQGTPYNLTTVTTYTSNKAAMLGQIQSTFAATSTPLSETLYTGLRYIAQLPQPFGTASYLYPCAFSGCGPAFQASQTAGGLGTTESNLLAAGDTCPTGLGYISGACARDPYLFGTNPAWVSSPNPKQVPCCKTFIMFLTDGEPQSDASSELDRFTYPAATATAIHGATCAGDYSGAPQSLTSSAADQSAYTTQSGCFDTISVAAGTGSHTIAPATLLKKHKTDYDPSYGGVRNHFLDEVAYWGHVTDLRQPTITYPNGTTEAGHDLAGLQNVTIYPVFAFGNISGREILMQAGKNGGFNDQNGNNLPDLQSEWDQVDNITGLLVPDGIPDTYFESQNANDMRDKLLAALTSILQKAASGTSVSVLATSSTGEGAIYQAYFFPTTFVNIGSNTTQVAWTGYTQGLFIDKFGNLREDYSASGCTGPPDGKLVLTHDCIIRVRLETDPTNPNFNSVVVDRFKDDGTAPGSVAGDGLPDTTTPFQTVALSTGGVSNVQPIWEGGRRLALLNPGASCEGSPTWPISGNMSQGGSSCRRIVTWADLNNGGDVGGTETLEFSAANAATLCPFLGGSNVLTCVSGGAGGAGQTEATKIINWVRGSSVSGLRDRTFNVVNDSGATVQVQWKLGDVIDATPVIVGAPSTRFDVIYGDQTYAQYFQRYKDRRHVSYVGANDGMLHAFNAGFFSNDDRPIDGSGPIVQARFTTTPKKLGLSTDCAALPCDASVTTYSFRSDAPPLGAELWAFIPQDLLPQLQWLTSPNYAHAYYVDLTPKVTDARIFNADADHPGGWGTVLIGGFRLGGSCTNCTSGKGTPRVVQADFNGNGTTTDTGEGTSGSDYRVFLSSYFVMDITNPEKEPTLLWVFRDTDLGLTTADPAIIRVNPSTDAITSSTNERWFVVFGTGPTHHDAFSTQDAQIFVVDLKLGPTYTDINNSTVVTKGKGKKASTLCSTSLPCINADTSVASGAIREYDTGITGAYMADAVTVDYNFDFRVDVVYAGSVICNGTTTSSGCGGSGPVWKGAMWRLTTNGGSTNPDTWGIACSGGSCGINERVPSTVISTFAYTTPQATTCAKASPCKVGPITTAPALTQDDTHNLWLFFGTGRFYSATDKSNVDIQHFFGVKDCIVSGGCSDQTVERKNLFNSSNVVTCSSCAAGSNVSTTGSTSSFTIGFSAGSGNLVNNIQNMDGWFTTFNDPTAPLQTPPRAAMTPGERSLASATLLGGTVFFTTFIPTTDICQATGTGQLYAVYYLTGGPYTSSAIGSAASGSNTLTAKSLSLGQGLPTQMQIHVGGELPVNPTGPTTPGDCAGSRVIGITQTSTGAAPITCVKPARSFYSRMVSWKDL